MCRLGRIFFSRPNQKIGSSKCHACVDMNNKIITYICNNRRDDAIVVMTIHVESRTCVHRTRKKYSDTPNASNRPSFTLIKSLDRTKNEPLHVYSDNNGFDVTCGWFALAYCHTYFACLSIVWLLFVANIIRIRSDSRHVSEILCIALSIVCGRTQCASIALARGRPSSMCFLFLNLGKCPSMP